MHRKNESGKTFYFKQFHIHHDRCSMKVGTDAVLLGAWAHISDRSRILDIGSGSGVIAIMLAQRSPFNTRIDGIEVEAEACEQATQNVAECPWPEKIKIYNQAVQNFEPDSRYDLIVSNPPYFINSLKPPAPNRTRVRHALELSHPDLIHSAKRLLLPTGRMEIILPYKEGLTFIQQAAKVGLFCSLKCDFRARHTKSIERVLLQFTFRSVNRVEKSLVLSNEWGGWSEEYQNLVSPFYLDSVQQKFKGIS